MSFNITANTSTAFNITLGGGSTGQIKVYLASTWTAKPVKVYNGSIWETKPVKYWDGGTWVTTTY